MIGARIKATLVEGVVCLALMLPIFLLLERQDVGLWLSFSLAAALGLFFAPLVLLLRAIARAKPPAEEHLRAGLQLVGDGCHLCRLMRFWLPLVALPGGVAAAIYWGSWGAAPLGLAVTAVHLATGLSALAEGREPHWARLTGFRFERTN
ncbi:MAG: hypothetical protein MK180_02580 [Rhodobacteraceae bacterium]|nr:hypothetical protein [Paracoccaceae bacterium]